jgi:formylmethanofuran dehydrogenase subunit B
MFVLPEQGAAIGGRAVPPAEAIAAAAALLRAAALPLLGGLRTDAAGALAAAALARRLGGVLDHAESETALRDISAMRAAGWIVTTPPQVRALADLVLLVGDGHAEAWPDFAARLGLDRPPTLDPQKTPRRVLHLEPGADLVARLGLLRALIKRRRISAPPALGALAEDLRGTRYGVAVWSAARLDALAVEMLCGLIDDLHAATRFAGLPLPAAGNAAGVAQALTAATGFPFRVAFRDGMPRHDPWRYDATRLATSGEADTVLWLDALGEGPPPWAERVKLVVLAPGGARFAAAPDVAIAVGRPGIDHAAVLHDPAIAALRAIGPATSAPVETAAALLGRITAALPSC